MKTKHGLRRFVPGWCAWLWPAATAGLFGMESDPLLASGREALIQGDLPAANAAFRSAVDSEPSAERARMALALTQLALLYERPGAVALLDRWGVDPHGRDLFDWTARSDIFETSELPSAADLGEAQRFLVGEWIPSLEESLAHLDEIRAADFRFRIRPATYGWGVGEELLAADLVDVKLVRAGLRFLLGLSRLVAASNNWELPLAVGDELFVERTTTVAELLEIYPDFGAPADFEARTQARRDWADAIAAYLEVAEALGDPNRRGAFFFVDEEGLADEGEFRAFLVELRLAMDRPNSVKFPAAPRAPETAMDLSPLFSAWSLRAQVPDFRGNQILLGPQTDPTLGGILLDFELEDWEQILIKNRFDWTTFHFLRASPAGDGWMWLDWFGRWLELGDGWIRHAEHGSLFAGERRETNLFLFDAQLGAWSWTSRAVYPWLYLATPYPGWVYYNLNGLPGDRWFYDPQKRSWRHESDW